MPFCNECGYQYEPDYDCKCDVKAPIYYESEPIGWLFIGYIGVLIVIIALALLGLYATLG